MHLRGPSAAPLLFVFALLAGLLAGCGGGGDQSGSGESQGGTAQGGQREVKIALGTVEAVVPDRRKIMLQPSAEVQGGERLVFKVRDKAEILLDDQPAEMADAKEGQQAQIEYVVVNEQNKAHRVELIADGEGSGG